MRTSEDYDSAVSDTVLRTFRAAWLATLDDYCNRRINSERCLQASLYRHLCNELSKIENAYRVFVEAVVLIPIQNDEGPDGQPKSKFKKVFIDTLICKGNSIVAAIEIKYVPRGNPKVSGIRKDLNSLSAIAKRKQIVDRIQIELPRYRSDVAKVLELNIHPTRKLILAAYCKGTARLKKEGLWQNHRPDSGRWQSRKTVPPQLGAAFALTSKDGQVKPDFFYPAFDRLDA